MSDAVIDQEWLAREVAGITTDLEQRFPSSLPAAVRAAVDEAARQLAPTAKIASFLPLLIRRAAVEMLGTLAVPPGVAERVAASGENA
jgi:hypothetical protein